MARKLRPTSRKKHAPSSPPPSTTSLSSATESAPRTRLVGTVVVTVSMLVLAFQLLRFPTDVQIPLLATQISIVDANAASSTGDLVLSPTSRQQSNSAAPPPLPKTGKGSLDGLPWKDILKLRQQKVVARMQQQQQQAVVPQTYSNSATVTREPPPPPQLQKTINGLPIILSKQDALYQKYTWDKSPIIIEKYKLVFFTVPKVGCTGFKQLFRRMMGHANWQDHQYYNEPFLPHNPHTNGLKYLSDYPFEQANEMMTSPEWTRAIFVRKPDERVLSAFLDKSAYSKGYYLRMRCCDKVATGSEEWSMLQCATGTKQYTAPAPGEQNIPILPFEQFLGKILPKCNDPHWEPQAVRMAPKYWDRIGFVGRFESLHEDTKRLLVHLGAWEEYGASGWVVKGQDGAIFDPQQKAVHSTKAQDTTSKQEYFTPKALEYIQQYYQMDYQHGVLKFEKPGAAGEA